MDHEQRFPTTVSKQQEERTLVVYPKLPQSRLHPWQISMDVEDEAGHFCRFGMIWVQNFMTPNLTQ